MQERHRLITQLAELLTTQQWMLATAESCTGGGIAHCLTSLTGSSSWFERGFVTYSNLAKQQMLGVEAALLEQHGAVSEEVAKAMAQGAVTSSQAQVSVSVTGIAGPGGATLTKPVGTVWFGWVNQHGVVKAKCQQFNGDREQVREQAIDYGLAELLAFLEDS